MYYLTVTRDGIEIVFRQPFNDYAAAVEFLGRYYRARVPGSRVTLPMTTEVVNGGFARTFGSLIRPESIADSSRDARYHKAAKQDVAFQYESSYTFLIESGAGIQDADAMRTQYESED